MNYYKKFKDTGPFAGFYWFQRPGVFLLDMELIKNVLIKDFNNFTNRGFYTNKKDDPLTGILFLLEGHSWKFMRTKISPTFTSGKMKFMFPTVISVGQEFVKVFGEMLQQQAVIEVKELLARFTIDVIGNCGFGIDCCSLRDPKAEFLIMGRKSLVEFRYGRIGSAFNSAFPNLARKFHMKITPAYIEEFFMRTVRETVEYREKHNIRRNDFMDLLLDLKNNKLVKSENDDELRNLTFDELVAQIFLFFVAGFETSSTTMGFALYELAKHEEIQERVRKEISDVLDNYKQELTYEAIKDMTFLNQVILETLRLYTVIPVLNRQCLNDYVVPGHPNYVIKKDMLVYIPAGAIHRDPKYYPNPDVFNPDNFTPEKVKERESVHYLAFGDGPRNCVGMRFGQMQTRIGLALLLKNFRFSVCSETQIPLKYSKKHFLLATESGIYLKAERV
ncbi:cytochrome P450 6a9-like isoform X2 [Teleopsis dalmanni]|nr:cytochrome P450 6a9-like isoform X2 [Teleopsis dalmanni]